MTTTTTDRTRSTAPPAGDPFAGLRGSRFLRLTTYRKSGQPVAGPIWLAADADRLYGYAEATSGKAKRLRRTSRVLVAPCTFRGAPRGPDVPAEARLLPPEDSARARAVLLRKYGWHLRLMQRFRGNGTYVYFEVGPAREQ